MSQSSLQALRKLQEARRKSQSRQVICDVSGHPDWLKFKAQNRSDQIDNLVLVSFLLLRSRKPTSDGLYSQSRMYCSLLLSRSIRLLEYPCPSEIHKYPCAVVCTCGNVLQRGGQNWGLVHHCSKCKRPHYGKRFYLPMFRDGIERTGLVFVISREWIEWAQVQAILLLTKQFKLPEESGLEESNHKSVTDSGE